MHIHQLGGELTAPFSMFPALQARLGDIRGEKPAGSCRGTVLRSALTSGMAFA
jgi:hypothetical protein